MPAPRVVPPLAELAKLIKADRENRVQRLAPRFQRIYELGQDPDKLEELGAQVASLVRRSPSAFERGPGAAESFEDLIHKYGVGYTPPNRDFREMAAIYDVLDPDTMFEVYRQPGRMMRDEFNDYNLEGMRNQADREAMFNSKRNLGLLNMLDMDKPYSKINSIGGRRGSGTGTRLYPAGFDVAALTGAPNLADPVGLTSQSQLRRNFLSVPALLRHQKSGLIYPSSDQLKHTPETNLKRFGESSPERQVGEYLYNGVLGVGDRLPNEPAFTDALGMLNSRAPLATFEALARHSRVPEVGPRSLRWTAIVDDLLSGQAVNPKALRGIMYARGGVVRRCPSR